MSHQHVVTTGYLFPVVQWERDNASPLTGREEREDHLWLRIAVSQLWIFLSLRRHSSRKKATGAFRLETRRILTITGLLLWSSLRRGAKSPTSGRAWPAFKQLLWNLGTGSAGPSYFCDCLCVITCQHPARYSTCSWCSHVVFSWKCLFQSKCFICD